jgi:hypothetical protein
MKSSIPIVCPACSEKFALEISGRNLPKYSQCPKCGTQPYNFWPLGNVVTLLLMERAKQELANGDVTIAILLSAIAVEGEMAYLFFKWKGIDSGKLLANQTPQDRKVWEVEWAKLRSIRKRLDVLSGLLTAMPFNEFACLRNEILKPALTGYDWSTTIQTFLQEQLFNKRNEIAHYGRIDFSKADGEQSVSLALALLKLLRSMDDKRIHVMDEGHKKARESSSSEI